MLRLCKRPEGEGVARLEGCGFSPQLCRMLSLRGVRTPEEARRFLSPSLENLHDPFSLYGMEAAVRAIRASLEAGERIAVYGDYDVDGVCATALLTEALRAHGAKAGYFIPSRHREGYGLNADAVREMARDFDLAVTVDCGVTNVEEAALAREKGLRLVVTDHHEPPKRLPQAEAVVDPLLGEAPFRGLCGAGVAWKLVCALFGMEAAEPLAELAALATVADLVPLLDENRVLVALGLKQLAQTRRPGLRELIALAGLEGKPLNAGHLGFQLGPRLNAGGRLGSAERCVRLLLTRDEKEGASLARELDEANRERQRVEAAIVREAEKQVMEQADFLRDRVLIAVGEGWNRGVVGLAAGRITEKYAWPSIVFSQEDGLCTGSARSVPGVNIYEALCACQDLYERFGGHAMAAGLTLRAENLPEFRRRLNEAVAALAAPDAYVPSVTYDFEVTLPEVTCELAEEFARLAPNGIGNPAPVLAARGAHVLEGRAVGAEGRHLKLRLEQEGVSLGGIAFGLGGEKASLPECVDVVFSPTINEWMGRRSAECDVKRLVPHEALETFRRACAEKAEDFELALLETAPPCDAPAQSEAALRAQVREALLASCQGTLLTVRTLEGALRWVNFLAEDGLANRLDCRFGRPGDARRFNCLCALPTPDAETGYERVIALDGAEALAALRALIPTDERLRALYRALRACPGPIRSEAALCAAAGMKTAAARLGLKAFDELGLVLFKEEPFEAMLLPMKRCQLADSATLSALRRACRWEEKG